MAYLLENGWNVALVDLDPISPQPRSDITTQALERRESADGSVHEMGLFIDLQWSMLDPETEYQSLLDQFGLDGSTLSAQVTVYVPNFEYTFTRYNGIAVRPMQGRDIRRNDYFIRNVTITVKNLTAL